jgi:hypothetical protein
VAHGPVEGAKATVFGAEICVIDVAIDNVRYHTFGMISLTEGVGSHADADQIVGAEQV